MSSLYGKRRFEVGPDGKLVVVYVGPQPDPRYFAARFHGAAARSLVAVGDVRRARQAATFAAHHYFAVKNSEV